MKDKDAAYIPKAKRSPTNGRDWVVATAVGGSSMVQHGNKNTNALFELNAGYQEAKK
tara:strand:+ start:918 stop:1088 length:171 start_codon:yes stop_codon:yes gene_type:complete